MSIITISRQDGSLGDEIASSLSEKMNMQLIRRDKVINEWMKPVVGSYELRMLSESPKFFLSDFKDGFTYKEYIERRLLDFVQKKESIILGMGGNIILSENPYVIRVKITASINTRINRIKNKYGLEINDAKGLLEKSDRKHKRYISTLYDVDWDDPNMYDLTINTDKLSMEQCIDILMHQIEMKNALKQHAYENEESHDQLKIENVIFKHPAEEEFAKILDMYNIEWQYEPRTFPVQWDAEGNVTMAFSPDFYLVKFDTYIEITTMEQKYVTTKNKKVKKLRELYPGININIVYKKDFHSLVKRFGLSEGVDIDEFNRG